jgi:hypothetical protein
VTDKNKSRKVLGRGLSALMADIEPAKTTETSEVAKGMMSVPIDSIEPNPVESCSNCQDTQYSGNRTRV